MNPLVMSLTPGTTFDHYEVLESIRAGGMGEVYKARDIKLGRDVAIKVLRDVVAQDEERLARFEREAKLLASLNHPAIATLHGLEDIDGTRFLVMELVEGETLAERIAREPIPIEEALALFRQVADGLEAAHEKSVIHRDLKPSNIMITLRGGIKILDFGLATVFEGAPTGADPSQSPTLSKGTAVGAIMGTPSYMSPEQARGKSIDKRTDVWAFGCCLYESLTGRKAFDGDNVTDILAGVVKNEPDWKALPASTPRGIRTLLRKCASKDPMRRLRDIGDAALDMEEAQSDEAFEPVVSTKPGPWPWAIAATGVVVGIVGFLSSRGAEENSQASPQRFVVELPEPATVEVANQQSAALALSPDGRRLAFVAGKDEGKKLYLRSLSSFEVTSVPESEEALNPFFSPDGRWIGFATNSRLMKAAVEGGPPIAIVPISPVSRGASWGRDDIIIVSPTYSRGLSQVSAAGGQPELLTSADRDNNEANHLWPQALEDGDGIVFTVWSGGSFDEANIVLLSRRTGTYRTLVEGGSHGRVTSSGHLVFARAGSLLAIPFDRDGGEVTGSPVPVLSDVMTSVATGSAQFDISENGTLAYIPAGPTYAVSLAWLDRRDNVERIAVEPRDFFGPRLSPDGSQILLTILTDLWAYDLNRDAFQRLTFRANNLMAIWSADGRDILFTSTIAAEPKLYSMPADGSGEPQRITSTNLVEFTGSVSPHGDLAFMATEGPGSKWDIWTVRLGEPDSARPFLETRFDEHEATFSPDGRWIAYVSDETGRDEVFVRSFPDSGAKWSVSAGAGREPLWSPDGKKLYYRGPAELMVVTVETRPSFSVSRPQAVVEDSFERFPGQPGFRGYDISPDGERFLVLESGEQTEYDTIHVVLNWFEELERLVPTR